MTQIRRSALVRHTPEQMFDLVNAVAAYPSRFDWCSAAEVLNEHDGGLTARLDLRMAGITQSFTTRNTHVPGREVHLQLVSGPFSNLDGSWKFTPVGAEGERACRVELNLSYGFSNFALQALVGPVFDKIASNLVEAFVKRAEQVYGAA